MGLFKHSKEAATVAEELEDRVANLEHFNQDLMSLSTVLQHHLEEFQKDDNR